MVSVSEDLLLSRYVLVYRPVWGNLALGQRFTDSLVDLLLVGATGRVSDIKLQVFNSMTKSCR